MKLFTMYVVDYMYERALRQRDKYKIKSKETLKSLKKTTKILDSACEIITRFENKKPEIYLCDCNKKNKQAVNDFFKKVVSMRNEK